jgi:hypothetical protein
MFHFLPMIPLRPCLIMERIITFNLRAFPKNLIPNAAHQATSIKRKPRAQNRAITGAILGKSDATMAIFISIGLGSTEKNIRA